MSSAIRQLGVVALALASFGAQAAIVHNAEIVGNVIFGSGNADGGWTINQTGNMELALRAKVRYDIGGDAPQNIFNANGDGTFSHAVGAPAAFPGRARWNFEWSVNTDASGTGGATISDFDFVLGIDSDAGLGTVWNTVSLLSFPFDHSFGTNATAQSAGVEAPGDAAAFAALAATSNLMQNSSNMDFVDDGVLFPTDFNPNIDGNYSFFLEARNADGETIGRTDITVIVGAGATAEVPEPASLVLVGLALAGLAASRRKKA